MTTVDARACRLIIPDPIPPALAHLTHPDPRQLQDADAPHLLAYLAAVPDPRAARGRHHSLVASSPWPPPRSWPAPGRSPRSPSGPPMRPNSSGPRWAPAATPPATSPSRPRPPSAAPFPAWTAASACPGTASPSWTASVTAAMAASRSGPSRRSRSATSASPHARPVPAAGWQSLDTGRRPRFALVAQGTPAVQSSQSRNFEGGQQLHPGSDRESAPNSCRRLLRPPRVVGLDKCEPRLCLTGAAN